MAAGKKSDTGDNGAAGSKDPAPGAGENGGDDPADTERPALTLAQAAKLARIAVKDVFDFKDHGGFVNVVTVASRKIRIDRSP